MSETNDQIMNFFKSLEEELNSEDKKQPQQKEEETEPVEALQIEETENTETQNLPDTEKLVQILGDDIYTEPQEDPFLEQEISLKQYQTSLNKETKQIEEESQKLHLQLSSYTDKKYYKDDKPFFLHSRDVVKQMANDLINNSDVSPIEATELLNEYDKIHSNYKLLAEKKQVIEQRNEELLQKKHSLEWDKAGTYFLKELPQIEKHQEEIRNLLIKDMQNKETEEINSLTYEDKVNAIKNAIKKSNFIKTLVKQKQETKVNSEEQPPDITANNSKSKTTTKTDKRDVLEKAKGMSQEQFNKLSSTEEDEIWSALAPLFIN